ncbi:2-succinyl-5-enolpyruvyl-6-hydroxy-3-cyclohexene-1-carboxylic-acid synthase [Aggregatimonas sangjinii]|uniref:2-succinyl-5-enolpyruvyl-6-hydroxy-3-cyclohexene-1-carboxylate synthase n=1 Tax=Aggregatimonas sangjinii TaxID=2583587 RepID=A0A5B7STJ6_9FLAO|nr:2-succinyl-5-enolpyruvyl-6-hydroxy-3-cyclohexene-1-carboxylic-acid synthase [Aggregatimonas sangjinii]QCX00190.1 2-succinyl-5-enolpyruvyl-6-hydroxy-3-cyclohexene-1-carboxylic-acid synthase [Aggregatimonas sangjinii]
MIYSSIPVAQSIAQHFKAKKIKNIVISPGSRNAPLTISFTEDPFFKCFSIVDERCAAFFALGIAQQSLEPVVVICTSGSALLNYYPAIAEAFYSDIPLVVLSADRPVYKIDVGDGQTIRQDNVFHRHIGYSADLRQDISHATDRIRRYRPEWLGTEPPEVLQRQVQDYNDGELNKALNLAITSKLPIHINVRLEEPLYNKIETPSVQANIVTYQEQLIPEIDYKALAADWNASKTKMVLVGVNWPDTIDQKVLNLMADDPSVIVLTETTSNLHHPKFFPSIDSLIAPIEGLGNSQELFEKLQPEVLLTFGGLVVSKKIKAFLREYQPKRHWHIDPIRAFDTFFCLSRHIKMDANDFLKKFLPNTIPAESSYFGFWNNKKIAYEARRKDYLGEISFCDMKAFNCVIENIPEDTHLQLANSSTVRYAQLYDLPTSLKVFCNRGTSGIDGSTSTAIGASLYSTDATVLITGDLGFFYDSNALWNNYVRSDFRIILLNNNGGGIFRILPGKEDSKNFETYFETVHGLSAKHLCKMYDFKYQKVSALSDLNALLPNFFDKGTRPKLLEINTPRIQNNKILLGYFDFISSVFINR